MKINSREELNHLQEFYSSRLHAQTKRILVCAGTGCVAGGSLLIYARLKELMEEQGIRCEVVLEEEPHEHVDGAGHTCHCEESAPRRRAYRPEKKRLPRLLRNGPPSAHRSGRPSLH